MVELDEGMPSEKDVARAIASFRKHIRPDSLLPDILPSEMAQASAVLALFAPVLAERDAVRRELHSLAVALHRKHYWHVKQWQPFDDAVGLATQIDNMTASLVPEARVLAAEADLSTARSEGAREATERAAKEIETLQEMLRIAMAGLYQISEIEAAAIRAQGETG
jgi:hypothetical protein